jgi:protein TonB
MGYQALLFCPDEKTARTVTQVLSELDFTVETCSEPFAAVKKLMAQHFDAVVVDCDNEQNATLLFKSARNSSANQSSLAVAVVEGQAGVAKAFRIGANLVLTKPINVEQAKGTLRVARGLLRKGGEAPKAAAPTAAQVTSTVQVPVAPRPVAPSPAAGPSATRTPAAPPVLPQKPAVAPPVASLSATNFTDVEDQEPDAILEEDAEPALPTPTLESRPAQAATTRTAKFPWQPSPKMAEPMASALRRAAEAAGQVESTPPEPAPTKPVLHTAPPEKRAMTGAMFQAQGHAAAPARALEKPSFTASASSAVEEPPVVSKPPAREISAPPAIEKSIVVDTSEDDVPPPTFFPGAYDAAETEGGSKTKALVIVAIVVLLGASAGYLSWKNTHGGKAASAATTQTSTPTAATSGAETSPPSSANAGPVATDITLSGAGTSTSAPPARPSAGKPAAKEAPPEPDSEPEVTQRLIVKNDTRPAARTTPQEQEPVQAPSAIGMGATTDTKALSSISSAPVSVPRAAPQLLRVSQGVMEGLVLKRVQPRYPTQALQMRIQGPVQLQATISKNGDIENLRVASGDAVLARAAVEAVKQWKYKPYYLNGEPVQIETQILVNFKLPN